jgi:hypothetical protein
MLEATCRIDDIVAENESWWRIRRNAFINKMRSKSLHKDRARIVELERCVAYCDYRADRSRDERTSDE